MDGWMDGWLDGGIDGWMDGWMNGWMDEIRTFETGRQPAPSKIPSAFCFDLNLLVFEIII